jgi:hypothetical protein
VSNALLSAYVTDDLNLGMTYLSLRGAAQTMETTFSSRLPGLAMAGGLSCWEGVMVCCAYPCSLTPVSFRSFELMIYVLLGTQAASVSDQLNCMM